MKKYFQTTLLVCLLIASLCFDGCQKSSPSPEMTKADGMVLITGGKFLMRTDDRMTYEAPVHEVEIKSFWIDEREVTVTEFAKIVQATSYKTDAEKFGWSGVFNLETGEWERVD